MCCPKKGISRSAGAKRFFWALGSINISSLRDWKPNRCCYENFRNASLYAGMRKVCPRWQRLQPLNPKSPPKARMPLWQLAQFMLLAAGKCSAISGELTCLLWGAAAVKLWQLVHFNRWPGPCLAWEKLARNARALVGVRAYRFSSWQTPHEAISRPLVDVLVGVWQT